MPKAITVPMGCHHKVPPSMSLHWWFGAIFKMRRHFIHQKLTLMPVGNRAELFPRKDIYAAKITLLTRPHPDFLQEVSTGANAI